jgi:hypothetical protein
MNDKIAEQMFDCIMEGVNTPYNQEEYAKSDKIEILEILISLLTTEKAHIKVYE